MNNIYVPCLCGSGKKFKFCCHAIHKKGETIPASSGCSKFPIYECKALKNWDEIGISPVCVVRELDKNMYVFISYLVDFWCLGVKDTTVKFGISKEDLKYFYEHTADIVGEELETISYEDARSLILGSIDFAKTIDLPPHPIWTGIPTSFIEDHLPFEKKFTFGKEGVPHYTSGPYDHENYDIEDIVCKVSNAGGEIILNLSKF